MLKDGKIHSERIVKTSVNLPDEMLEALRHRAELTGNNLGNLIRVAIRRYLEWLDFLDAEGEKGQLDNVDRLYREEYRELRVLAMAARKTKEEGGRKGGQKRTPAKSNRIGREAQ